jgi:ParB family chromosome partitioning protein
MTLVATWLPRDEEHDVSTKINKLLAMTGDINPEMLGVPGAPGSATADPQLPTPAPRTIPPPGIAPKTGPGQMVQFRGQMLAAEGELAKLRKRLEEHDGSLPTRKLDPAVIVDSRWANRHADSFKTAKFESLKADIEKAGGNVQPICVSPAPDAPGRYQVIFGHRRLRACAELGISVLATIVTDPISEVDLFTTMDRENRERADLAPYEQGLMYRRALDAGLFPSNRRLAESIGISHTWVSNALAVADLPPAIIECFRTPIEIQHRHAKEVQDALDKDRKAVLRRAEKLRQVGAKLPPKDVVSALVQPAPAPPVVGNLKSIEVAGKKVGSWSRDTNGHVNIRLDAADVPDQTLLLAIEAMRTVLQG